MEEKEETLSDIFGEFFVNVFFYSVLPFFVIVIYLSDIDEWLSNDNTVYYVFCLDDVNDLTKCKNDKKIYSSTTYSAIAESQSVVYKANNRVIKLKNCNVIDRNNWQCNTDDQKKYYFMDDGEYRVDALPPLLGVHYSPKWRWFISNPVNAIKTSYKK